MLFERRATKRSVLKEKKERWQISEERTKIIDMNKQEKIWDEYSRLVPNQGYDIETDLEWILDKSVMLEDDFKEGIRKYRPEPLTVADGYLNAIFLNYSDEEKRWNEVRIKQVDPVSVDVVNIDENSDEYMCVFTISDDELKNVNNCKKL